MQQKIEPFNANDIALVEAQRKWIRKHYDPDSEHKYDTNCSQRTNSSTFQCKRAKSSVTNRGYTINRGNLVTETGK
jgi:hypothetical protein